MSATLPARLGKPSRALIVARRLGPVRERFPVVLGTLVSQTLLVVATIAPLVLLALVFALPALLRRGKPSRSARAQQWLGRARGALVHASSGLQVFRRPTLGSRAAVAVAVAQLSAWALQWLACWALLVALGLDAQAGLGAAAAVLFAVNVTAAIPVTPSNLGVFQAACVAVLSAYDVGHTDALAYGIILQVVEIATAVRARHAGAGRRGHHVEGSAPAHAARGASGAGARPARTGARRA